MECYPLLESMNEKPLSSMSFEEVFHAFNHKDLLKQSQTVLRKYQQSGGICQLAAKSQSQPANPSPTDNSNDEHYSEEIQS